MPDPQISDAGTPYLDLFYRPLTREFSLALCISFAMASALSASESEITPHITLGKILLDNAQNTVENRATYKQKLHSHEGTFSDFAALSESIRTDYTQKGGFQFDAVYIAPADNKRLSVPRGPVLPEYGTFARR